MRLPIRTSLCLTQVWPSLNRAVNQSGRLCAGGPFYWRDGDPPDYAANDLTSRTIMKRTFQPSNLVRARRHGFFARKKTVGGRKVLRARRKRGRKTLCA